MGGAAGAGIVKVRLDEVLSVDAVAVGVGASDLAGRAGAAGFEGTSLIFACGFGLGASTGAAATGATGAGACSATGAGGGVCSFDSCDLACSFGFGSGPHPETTNIVETRASADSK
jgi:hypothetical protein